MFYPIIQSLSSWCINIHQAQLANVKLKVQFDQSLCKNICHLLWCKDKQHTTCSSFQPFPLWNAYQSQHVSSVMLDWIAGNTGGYLIVLVQLPHTIFFSLNTLPYFLSEHRVDPCKLLPSHHWGMLSSHLLIEATNQGWLQLIALLLYPVLLRVQRFQDNQCPMFY